MQFPTQIEILQKQIRDRDNPCFPADRESAERIRDRDNP
jgi:hypothetical protein